MSAPYRPTPELTLPPDEDNRRPYTVKVSLTPVEMQALQEAQRQFWSDTPDKAMPSYPDTFLMLLYTWMEIFKDERT